MRWFVLITAIKNNSAVNRISRVKIAVISLLLLILAGTSTAAIPIDFDYSTLPATTASRAWPLLAPLPAPDGLRSCCAFGHDLHVKLYGIPVPFYRIHNIVTAHATGHHYYNDSSLETLLAITGLGHEHNGIIYTHRGGFIDTAHIRDSADMTLYLFSQLWPRFGQSFTLSLPNELAQRQLVFYAFTPPDDAAKRYTLAAWLSASLAYQLAAWHEIAQWYGYQSVAGFSERISAFSPEDLYSNLLGTRIAATLLLSGHAATQGMYQAGMDTLLPQVLDEMGAVSASHTQFHFDMLDGLWWNSHCAVPDKFLLIRRNYQTAASRLPTAEPRFTYQTLRLTLPDSFYGYNFTALAQLRLLPDHNMRQLPAPHPYYTVADFPQLAQHASQQDQQQHPANTCH